MTTLLSQSSSPATSPPAAASPSTNPNHPSLPPLITSPPSRRSTAPRPMSHASKNRLSQYSTGSVPSRSRPPSHIFPTFPSSLTYTLVRDFAYPIMHPMHYGPPPEPSHPASGLSTPLSESRRLSDPPAAWETKMSWDTGAWGPDGFGRNHDLPSVQFADGPPWSEDEDLASPVVSSRHRKHKSSSAALGTGRTKTRDDGDILHPAQYERERGFYVSTSGDGSERYYLNQGGEANGPGGEYVTYPPDDARHSSHAYQLGDQPPRQYAEHEYSDASSSASSPGFRDEDQSRYSRDYQFTITSPDEEMHGKAVALFDFERENENELPLVEGQIIWVSYRHGQGWLVAEDPKTQESGLVPEEYVRLLRDIEGGMNSLTGNLVSTFSTSSKDLDPYPTQQLGIQSGQPPPQVVHYHGQRGGSQANTPTLASHQDVGIMRRGSQDTTAKKSDSQVSPLTEATTETTTETKTVDRSSTPKAKTPSEKPADPDAMETDNGP